MKLSKKLVALSYLSTSFFVSSNEIPQSSEFSQIDKSNIDQLEKVWTYNSGEFSEEVSVQVVPIYTGNILVTTGIYGSVIGIDPKTGNEIWKTQLKSPAGRRGITFSKKHNTLFIPNGDGVALLDPINGKILKSIITDLSLLKPMIAEDKMMVATLNNGVKAYDITNGKELWHANIKKGNVSPRIWSGANFDHVSNQVLINTSNPGGLYGGERLDDDYSMSLIAIDANTGKINWYYQHLIHDVWDYDLVGYPIIFTNNKLNKRSVISLSKTGEIIYLDINTGEALIPNSIKKITVPKSDVPGEILSEYQNYIALPEPVISNVVDLKNDFDHLDEENYEYVKSKLVYAKSELYLPTSLNYDAVIYGLHGGPQWPGGTLDKESLSLFVPYNKDPWFLRLSYYDTRFNKINIYAVKFRKGLDLIKDYINIFMNWIKSIFTTTNEKYKNKESGIRETNIDLRWSNFQKEDNIANLIYQFLPNTHTSRYYKNNCSDCHGVARQGFYENEYHGDFFIPPLAGLTLNDKGKILYDVDELNKIHKRYKSDFIVKKEDLDNLRSEFQELDNVLLNKGFLKINFAWQLILDKDGYPATKPPWGGISKINLNTGKIEWSIPFGKRLIKEQKKYVYGDKNFGGVLITGSNLLFATGTPDEYVRAFDAKKGDLVWESKLPFAGSAPPMTFMHDKCQYLIINATGGQFVGFRKDGDATVAYRLKGCN